jgi:hypothetical protein
MSIFAFLCVFQRRNIREQLKSANTFAFYHKQKLYIEKRSICFFPTTDLQVVERTQTSISLTWRANPNTGASSLIGRAFKRFLLTSLFCNLIRKVGWVYILCFY